MSGAAGAACGGLRNSTICEESFEESDVVVSKTAPEPATRFMIPFPKKVLDNSNTSSRRFTPLGYISDSPITDEGKIRSNQANKVQRRHPDILIGKRLDFHCADNNGPLTPAEVHLASSL
jgi:hypothetical protein